ncbi:hypothetical protein ACLOJK_031798 [Asimina triloba]
MAIEKGSNSIHTPLLSLSLACLVLSFCCRLFDPEPQLTWSKRAAMEAEAVASISCSGHGRAFVDGPVGDDGKSVCMCNSCYRGPDCSQVLPDCPVDVDSSGDPMFSEPFWMKEAESSAVVVSGWHQMSYTTSGGSIISRELEKHIRLLHEAVGNANASGKFMVFGVGSTQLLHAAVQALSLDGSSSHAAVVASVYKSQTELSKSKDYEWEGDAREWEENGGSESDDDSSGNVVIEFVTSPNNPDGHLQQAVLRGLNVRTIHDLAYYWPQFTEITTMEDGDLMLFSMSKATGHGGSRFGWALIKEEKIYKRMLSYMEQYTWSVSFDTQLRALKLLKVVLRRGGRDFFQFGHTTLGDRWLKLSNSLSNSSRFSLQKLSPHYCNYFHKARKPSPAYGWVKCEMEEDGDCHAVLKAGGIIGRHGSQFGAEPRYVRLSLVGTQDDFDLLLHKIEALVATGHESISRFASMMSRPRIPQIWRWTKSN